MKPEDVSAEEVEKADLALADRCIRTRRYEDECDCPTEQQIRVTLAAVLPLDRLALLEEMQNEVKAWHVYESRDTGDVFPSDAVIDLIQDRIDSLTATTEEPTT